MCHVSQRLKKKLLCPDCAKIWKDIFKREQIMQILDAFLESEKFKRAGQL